MTSESAAENNFWKCAHSTQEQADDITQTFREFKPERQNVAVQSLTWFNLIDSKKADAKCPGKTTYSQTEPSDDPDNPFAGQSAWVNTNTFGMYTREANGTLAQTYDPTTHRRADLVTAFQNAQSP